MGAQALTVQDVMPREKDFKQTLCADIDGFSLHAAVRCGADDRQALEQLCRCITRTITRPALANERAQTNVAGQVVLKLKTPWRDGTTHLVMSALEFMQRLAALVPRPRLHLIRFGVRITSLREVSGPPLREHGVLAPNAKLRALVGAFTMSLAAGATVDTLVLNPGFAAGGNTQTEMSISAVPEPAAGWLLALANCQLKR